VKDIFANNTETVSRADFGLYGECVHSGRQLVNIQITAHPRGWSGMFAPVAIDPNGPPRKPDLLVIEEIAN
jgi:hypothetical protein